MANSNFKLTSEQVQQDDKDPVVVFYLRGWLDAQSEETFFSAVQEAYNQGTRNLIVHLEEVQILTSAGIRTLQKIYKLLLSESSSGLRLCSASPQVYHVLALTGFLQSSPMYETLQAALKSYKA